MAEPKKLEREGRQWSEDEKRELAEKIESMSIEELAEFFDNTDTSNLPMEDASDEIQIRREMESVSVRLPKEDVAALKRRAAKSGVGYTTLLRMIVHEHVHSPLTR